MPVYSYVALNAGGKNVKGQINAENDKQAKDKLKVDKLFVTKLTELSANAVVEDNDGESVIDQAISTVRGMFSKASIREVALLTRQLAVLLKAGIPLVDSLTALIEQAEKQSLYRVLSQVRDDVNEGASLGDSMAKHPGVFSTLYVNMVRAGESSGTIEIVLARLADFMEGQAALKQKIVAALAYPVMIMLVMVGMLIFMVYFVIPNMLKMFEQSEMELPIYTRILIGFVELVQGYWWAIAIVVFGVVVAIRRVLTTEKGRDWFDELKFKLPGIKKMVLYVAIARFSRTLGTLLKSGVSMIVSLRIVSAVVGNKVMRDLFDETERAVTEGAPLAQPLKASGLFPPTVIHMVSAGESSGELEDMLLRIAETYEDQVESYTVVLTSVLEPLIIVVMTIIVGFVLVSILMPMMQMNNVL